MSAFCNKWLGCGVISHFKRYFQSLMYKQTCYNTYLDGFIFTSPYVDFILLLCFFLCILGICYNNL